MLKLKSFHGYILEFAKCRKVILGRDISRDISWEDVGLQYHGLILICPLTLF